MVGIACGVFGLLILFRGLIDVKLSSSLWADGFDPNLIYWILEWGHHSLFQSGSLSNFWNANQFFPHLNSLAYSDSFLTAQIFYSPLRFLGFSPLEALYGFLFSITILGCILTDIALVRVGGFNNFERCLIIYIAHFSMCITNFLVHYQLFAFQLAPSFLLFYYLFLRDLDGKILVFLSLIFFLAVGVSTYFAPMLGSVVLLTSWVAFKKIKSEYFSTTLINGIKKTINQIGLLNSLITTSILIALYKVQLEPYLKLFNKLPTQDLLETASYSAKLWSLFTQASTSSFIYKPFDFQNGYWEYSYFPGIILLSTLLIGIYKFIIFRKNPYHVLKNSDYQLLYFLFFIILISYLLSIGSKTGNIYLPGYLISKIIPGFASIRAPGRFGMLLSLPIAILSVYVLRYFFDQHVKNMFFKNTKYVFLVIFYLILVVFDSLLDSKIIKFEISHQGFYQNSKKYISEGEPTLVLPLAKEGHIETILNFMDQMKGSTFHYGWIVAGYGSRSTSEVNKFVDLDRGYQNGKNSVEELILEAKHIGIRKIIIFPEDYQSNIIGDLAYVEGAINGFKLLICENHGCIYEINQ